MSPPQSRGTASSIFSTHRIQREEDKTQQPLLDPHDEQEQVDLVKNKGKDETQPLQLMQLVLTLKHRVREFNTRISR